ncbi:hypothetical protein E2I00_006498, partial [Balaenoptera physalus]
TPRATAFTPGLRFCPRDASPSWCWGSSASRPALSADCKFTCHYRCRALVCLDCCGPRDLGWEPALERDTNVMTWSSTTSSGYCSQEDSDSELEQYFTARTSLARRPRRDQDEPVEWETPDLSQAEIEQKIKEYNGQINSNLFMSLNKDGSYTGFIKVQLKLVRPVSVPATKKPPSLQDARRGPGRGTAFLVVDDPRKFALFERAERHGQVYLRKLSDDEQPLRLRLLAGPSEKALSFVLKENDSGEVNWDAFSMPELHNFLRILQREEEEHLRQILQKYSYCRQKIQEALHACPLG